MLDAIFNNPSDTSYKILNLLIGDLNILARNIFKKYNRVDFFDFIGWSIPKEYRYGDYLIYKME